MKFTLKFLLFLCFVSAVMYAASPLWLSYIVARQLPSGWQLVGLDADYPGLSGIDIHGLRVKGGIQAADMTIAVPDLRFSYQGLKTAADSITLDIYLRSPENRIENALTLDDLSLPVTNLTGKLPELSVNQLRATIHFASGPEAGNIESSPPLVLDFEALKLTPRSDISFQLVSTVRFEAFPRATGQIEVEMGTDSFKADIRFKDDPGPSPWLAVRFEQKDQTMKPATWIQVIFDAALVNRDRLDSILKRSTGGLLTHVGGKLEVQADFAGQNLQNIEHLSLATEKLLVVSNSGVLDLKAELLASREGENIIVKLPTVAEIQYLDQSGWIDDLLTGAMPGFQRLPRSEVNVLTELGSNSRFLVHIGTGLSVGYNGDINFGLSSSGESLDMQADDLQVELADFPKLDSVAANGLITLNWEENTAFSYTVGEMELKADKLTVEAELTSSNGNITSTGNATLIDGLITNLAASATRVNTSWQDLDLLSLTGKLSTQTQGFSAEFDANTWTDFDFDISYNLRDNANVDGSGQLKFVNNHQLPFEFAGNTQTEQWDITLPSTTINLAQLESMLGVAHVELPESAKLTDGSIDLQGDLVVGDAITARLVVNGHEFGASMLENTVSKTSFSFNTIFDKKLSFRGPASIEFIALAVGIEVTGIKADLKLEDHETFGLQNLYAELFEGQLNLDSLRFSNNRIEDTTAELSHINLGHLLRFADIDGLEGTGLLDISLPVNQDKNGVNIRNGSFQSNGPGHLAYTKKGLAGSNIGLQALENFQYQDLSGTIDYQSDGTYLIFVHLDGKNPDLYGGHPVVFNLNINGVLPELFETLFITGDFEEAILKEIREQ